MGVDAVTIQQITVRAPLGNAVFRDYDDLVCVPDRGEAVSDGDCRTVLCKGLKALLDMTLAFVVQCACGFVKNQDRRVFSLRHDQRYSDLFRESLVNTVYPLSFKKVLE